MPVELTVPESGESITEVQIGEWRKAVGDYVEMDEVVCEIETDKAAIELPAPISGRLTKILKQAGEEAAVGDVIALMEAGEAPEEAAAAPAPRTEKTKAEQPRTEQPAPRVMPAAARVLSQAGLNAADASASGPGGRVLKEDAERAAAPKTAPASPAPAAAPVAPVAPGPPPVASAEAGREEEVIPMSPMRKVIARNLVSAQQTAALLTTFNEVDMSAVIELRKRYKEAFVERHGIKLGFMSFFVKAAVEALKAVPGVNAEIRGEHIVYRKYQDIGVAVGGKRGLVVPVLRNAEALSFAEIETKIADLAKRAQTNKLDLAELRGGTFTISNGGVYGSMLSTPIVNPPQSGILGLHAIQDRPAAVDGEVVIRKMMYLALTYDHRIVDGREAVGFLRRIKDVIERPERLMLEV